MKKIVIIETIAVFFLGITILAQLIGFSWSRTEIYKSCQPESVDYQSWDPYCLWVYTEQETLGTKPLVVIAKKADPDGVFHGLYYPYVLNEQSVSEINVTWNESGVEIINSSGFTIKIPKKSFIGGR